MKRHNYFIATVAIIATAVLVSSAFAQTVALRAAIPFDFYVGDKLLPAGTYTIEPGMNGNAIRVFDKQKNTGFILIQGYKANKLIDKSRIVFSRYGDTRFLTNVYWAGYKNGQATVPSARQKEMAKNSGKATSVELVVK
jgi:hypothetical protein